MNVTELARILKIPTQELRDKLPQLGFDIGQKAIKIDNRTANRIIKEWPRLIKELKAREQQETEAKEKEIKQVIVKKEIKIPGFITVRNFAQITNIPVNQILAELMKNGVFTSLNERIDYETAAIIGADLGIEVKLDQELDQEVEDKGKKIIHLLSKEDQAKMQHRPPVIVVMGHVDHGKTKLLDSIRKTHVIDTEAGGITQHIGAYQVERQGKTITFIDTPGHEAFTAMRSRGAKIADIAILVVAADDGVKPQTIEAFRIIEAAKLPFIVAINKIDKPEANIEKTKQELTNQLKIVPEDWGGKTICAPISAKLGQGIDDLLDMVLLTADLEANKMKANPDTAAIGTIIESRIDKGEGPVATVLVQNGTLTIGDAICFNKQLCGKVRALKNYLGLNIKYATPGMPAKIIGLKIAPAVGDVLQVGQGEKMKTKQIRRDLAEPAMQKSEEEKKESSLAKKINLIIKSDVLGSGEAIEESLAKIEIPEVKINIIKKGLGNITEGDIAQAEANHAQIIGFNIKLPPAVEELAREINVKIKIYNIIYELINDIKIQVEEQIEPEIKRVDLGKLKVLAIFRTEAKGQIIGGKVTQGKVETDSLIEVMRDQQIIATGKLLKLQAGKQDVNVCQKNQECGIEYQGKPIVKEGDILQIYKKEKTIKKI